jgi:hypothetical protein
VVFQAGKQFGLKYEDQRSSYLKDTGMFNSQREHCYVSGHMAKYEHRGSSYFDDGKPEVSLIHGFSVGQGFRVRDRDRVISYLMKMVYLITLDHMLFLRVVSCREVSYQ